VLRRCPTLTAHIDLYKTFCELAGAKIPDDIQTIDGRSMLPLLEDPKADWPDRELFVHVGRWEKGEDPNKYKYKKCAIRTRRWRFVNNSVLYDIANDPYEDTNVIEKHPEVAAKLRNAYDKWWAETVPLMVNEKRPLAAEHPQEVRYEKQLKERGIPDWIPPKL
jgi:arylsulfatase A-like enzyme